MSKNNGLRMFGYGLLSLISNGKKEMITKLKEEAYENNLVTYVCDNYKNQISGFREGEHTYDIDNLNKYFYMMAVMLNKDDARRKYGILNESDGLLLLVSLILENYIEKDEEWNKEGFTALD